MKAALHSRTLGEFPNPANLLKTWSGRRGSNPRVGDGAPFGRPQRWMKTGARARYLGSPGRSEVEDVWHYEAAREYGPERVWEQRIEARITLCAAR